MTESTGSASRPITAGIVCALVGFTSSFVVILTGLAAVGASPREAASGLLSVSVTMGAGSILLASWTRIPITVAWSTPGAALLAATGVVAGGWPAAVGAFLLTGALIVLTGLVSRLGALIAAIPTAIAQAMLAGILFQLCLGPVTGMAKDPLAVAPVVVVWLLALRFSPRWASPLAFCAAAVVIAVHLARSSTSIRTEQLLPHVVVTTPTLTFGAVIGIALPLYVVTMASQNVPGVAVMKGLGYQVPWRRSMLVTGAGTVLGAPAGGHAINLAAISAALAAGPEAGPDRSRRWIASVTSGVVVIGLGLAAGAFGQLVVLAPAGVIAAVAGLALMSTLASSLTAAMATPENHLPAVLTFVTAASGIAVAGVSAAFWALVVGLIARAVLLRPSSAA